MILIHDLKKTYGSKVAVDIPEYTIAEGEILGLVGNNGAGKTTLFRLMLDLLKADSGNVTINDIDVSRSDSWKNFTGAYLDESFLIDYLTPEEYFCFVGNMCGFHKGRNRGTDGGLQPLHGRRNHRAEEVHPQPFCRKQTEGGDYLCPAQPPCGGDFR